MPELIDETELRERFDIHVNVKAKRLEPCIRAAARRLRQWVGTALYDLVLTQRGDVESLSDAELERLSDLKDCEAYLAMHFAIASINTQVRIQGMVAEEKLAEGGTVIRLRNADEVGKFIELYLQQAREMAEPYFTQAAVSSYEFASFGVDDLC
jgi:GTPase